MQDRRRDRHIRRSRPRPIGSIPGRGVRPRQGKRPRRRSGCSPEVARRVAKWEWSKRPWLGVETDAAGDFTDLEGAAADGEQLVEPPAWVDPEEVLGELEFALEDLATGELEFDLAPDGQPEIAGQLTSIGLASVVPGLEAVGTGRAELQFVLFHGGGREFEV